MRKVLSILLGAAITLTLCACDQEKIETAALTTILYNTTPITDINESDGTEVTLTGYISMASPLDNTCAYLMNTPFNADPVAHTSDSTVTDMVACYPPTGQYIKYTEECITVRGKIKSAVMKEDAKGYSYPFYLVDCTYTIYSGNDNISEYNYGITSGCLQELDKWLTSIYQGLSSPSTAEVIDVKSRRLAFDTKSGSRSIPNILGLVEDVEALCSAYNKWVETSPTVVTDELTEDYINVGTKMSAWMDKLTVRGDEI